MESTIVSGAIQIKMTPAEFSRALAALSAPGARDIATLSTDLTGQSVEFPREALRKTILACYAAFSKDKWDLVNMSGNEPDLRDDINEHLDNLMLMLDVLKDPEDGIGN